jgi:hypothetical protein
MPDDVAKVVEVLRPFAAALDDWGDEPEQPDTRDLWEHPMSMCITLGDFRRAHAFVRAHLEGEAS